MLFFYLLALFQLCRSEAKGLGDPSPEEMVEDAVKNIGKYLEDNGLQVLRLPSYENIGCIYDFEAADVRLADLSTIQTNGKPQVELSRGEEGTRYKYNVTVHLKNGYLHYDYRMKVLALIKSSGEIVATSAPHSIRAEGSVLVKHSDNSCEADLISIDVHLSSVHADLKPHGFMYFFLRPFFQYLTNAFLHDMLPIHEMIPDFIKTAFPQSKLPELVCKSFTNQ